jgi:hypothetical protein
MLCYLLFEGEDEYEDISSLSHMRFYEVTACHLPSCTNVSKLMASPRDAGKSTTVELIVYGQAKEWFQNKC